MEKKKRLCLGIAGFCVMAGISVTGIVLANRENEKKTETREQNITSEEETLDKETYEKGYNLPLSEKRTEIAKSDCSQVMDSLKTIYENCEKGDASNAVITEDTAAEMLEVLADTKHPVSYYEKVDMKNPEELEDFLTAAENGTEGDVVTYELHMDGGISRNEFVYDGQDMYFICSNGIWNEDNSENIATTYTRINHWEYTEKGWFCYELCVPKQPEVTEVVNGNYIVRVKPMNAEYRTFSENYLSTVGYKGNNMFFINWDENNLSALDYNGLFEYFYAAKHGEQPDIAIYGEGIPKTEFETLMKEYLPVTDAQLEEYAAFDKSTQTYIWQPLTCSTYDPNDLGTSIPEVTNIVENGDGTKDIYIDAVCEMDCTDAYISHILTVKIEADGSVTYLGNQISQECLNKVEPYQYRAESD